MFEDNWFFWGAGVVGTALVVALFVLMVQEGRQWEAFRRQHACKPVAHISGEVFPTYGFGANGQMTVGVGSTSGKTGWLCDDGITYFR